MPHLTGLEQDICPVDNTVETVVDVHDEDTGDSRPTVERYRVWDLACGHSVQVQL